MEFILVGEKGNNPDSVHGYCIKINNNGDVVQTLDINSGSRVSRLGTINPYPVNEGGTLIAGGRYNYLTPENRFHNIFILKTDSAGKVLSLPENQKELMSEAILAPNPGGDFCIALLGAQYKSATLHLYNLNGELVLCKEIQDQKTIINLPGLTQGIYTYAFEHEGRIIGNGKWIRE